jgi:hypothetical protein
MRFGYAGVIGRRRDGTFHEMDYTANEDGMSPGSAGEAGNDERAATQ